MTKLLFVLLQCVQVVNELVTGCSTLSLVKAPGGVTVEVQEEAGWPTGSSTGPRSR